MKLREKVDHYALLHKQNLNGRETEDELFEAGISVGIQETENLRDEFAIGFAEWVLCYKKFLPMNELLEIYKNTL